MREIGGYLELESYHNLEYHHNALKLNTARNALEYIIKVKNIKKIYIPKYSCESIVNICKKNNIEMVFYDLNMDFSFCIDDFDPNAYLYIINYFGQLSLKQILKYKNCYHNVILDNVQSFFAKPIKGIDTIYSCRKYFGVSDGAYLYLDSNEYLQLNVDISYQRYKHLLGRFELNASDFYEDNLLNEKFLDNEPLKIMSKLTQNILRSINYKNVLKIRKQNFKFLHKYLKKYNKLKLKNGTFMYPLYTTNAEKLRKILISQKIYVPILWPNSEEKNGFSKNILCLPIDQRYNINDMQQIINIIDSECRK